MFGIILILASLIVVHLDAGVGVFGVGKMVPLPMWLFRPHGVGLLDLVDDVLLNDMLLEVREHLCMGQHCVDVFHECCLWIWRLVEGMGHLVDGKFALVEQLLVVDRWELHEIQVICICGSGMVGQLLCPTIAVWRCGCCHLSDEALCGWAEPLVGVVNSASGPWSILGAASGTKVFALLGRCGRVDPM